MLVLVVVVDLAVAVLLVVLVAMPVSPLPLPRLPPDTLPGSQPRSPIPEYGLTDYGRA